jgi:ABC-2 type transport system permease protein
VSSLAAPAREPGDLRVIGGPSAFGGGWRRTAHLTWLIASTDFKLTYFGSLLGYLWSLMRPLLFFSVLYVVFTEFARFGTVPHFPALLLVNLVLFSFFQEATGASVASLVVRESLIRKMHFPRIVVPLSTVVTSGLSLLVNLPPVLAFVLISGVEPQWTWLLLLPLLVVPLALFTTGVAMTLSSLYVRYRDVAPIWSVVSQMLFYASPIFYVAERVPDQYRDAYLSNPIAALLTQARRWIIDPDAPGVIGLMGWPAALLPLAVGLAVCGYGLWIFNRMAPHTRSICPSQRKPSISAEAVAEIRWRSSRSSTSWPIRSAICVGSAGASRQFSSSRRNHVVCGLRLETVAVPQAMNSNGW